MKNQWLAGFCLLSLCSTANSAVFFHNTGVWPTTWPQELEAFRGKARTVDVAHGTQEHIYEIPMADREEFEKLWPVILKLHTHGGRLRICNTLPKDPEPGFLKYGQPAIRIYGPSGGISMKPDIDFDPNVPHDFQKMIRDGLAVKAAAPWPKQLIGKDGQLPEYVTSVQKDGKMRWEAVTPGADPVGFQNRCRIDIDLVVDGSVIDLNRIALPYGSTIQDDRFNNK